ncbi:MAG: hypothetical protein U0599_30730 [Vicinamibacteria bacterium]
MWQALGVALLLGAGPQSSSWSPPDAPNPTAILNEARRDTIDGRYEAALQKHLWFHEHALQYQPGLRGVRVSFALADWARLADQYPPAAAALKDSREKAWARVLSALSPTTAFEAFQDFSAINRTLREDERTMRGFEQLDRERPELATRVAPLARPALVRNGRYPLCAKYVSAEDARRAAEVHRLTKESAAAGRIPGDAVSFADKRFENEAATVVALLVVSGRETEATALAEELRQERTDPAFGESLSAALKGTVPHPWP